MIGAKSKIWTKPSLDEIEEPRDALDVAYEFCRDPDEFERLEAFIAALSKHDLLRAA